MKLKTVSRDEAFDAICFLKTFEPQNESEARDIECAIIGLQQIIKKRDWYEATKDERNAERRRRRAEDPEFAEMKRAKEKRYFYAHKEEIYARNRKYYKKNYTKTAGMEDLE